MRRTYQLFIMVFKIINRFFLQFVQVLVIVYQSCTKIDHFDMQLLCQYDVLRFEVSVDDLFWVKVGDCLKNFRKVKQHDVFLLFHEIQIVLDPCHELEHIAIGTVVEDFWEVGIFLDGLMQFDDTLMVKFPQDKRLNECFMDATFIHEFFYFECFKGVLQACLIMLHKEDFAIWSLSQFGEHIVILLMENFVH